MPNDVTLDDPDYADHLRARPGVTYADDRCHFGVLDIRGEGDQGGASRFRCAARTAPAPYRKTFTEPDLAGAALGVRVGARQPRRDSGHGEALTAPASFGLRAALTRGLASVATPPRRYANRLVRLQHAGARRFTLRIGSRGRSALSRPGRLWLNLTGRYRSPSGQVTLRRVRRLLRR